MKKNKAIKPLIIIGLIVAFILFLRHLDQKMDDARALDPAVYTKTVKKEYLKLFNDSTKLKLIESREGKFRQPITNFSYQNEFRVQVQGLDSDQTRSLSALTKLSTNLSHITYDYIYSQSENGGPAYIRRVVQRPEKMKAIFLNFSGGEPLIIIKNDSVACYHASIENFSIKYSEDGVDEIFVEPSAESGRLPMEVAFIKKQKNIYLIIFYSMGRAFKPGILLGLLNK